jgi:Fic family protein
VASSTRIEGVRLSDTEVKALLSGLDINSFKNRDEEEVAGYAETMNMIFENYRNMSTNENTIKQLHQVLLKFRAKIFVIEEIIKLNNHVEAFGPDGRVSAFFRRLHSTTKDGKLCQWLSKTLFETDEHPLLVIAKFILDFLAIHLFQDGNGRLSKLTFLLLKSN